MPRQVRPGLQLDQLASLHQQSTQALSLYVMQNEFGAIKIGRSSRPTERLVEVARHARCRVELVAELPKAGHREEWVHLQMAKHWLVGEWFSGKDEARACLHRVLATVLSWPHEGESPGLDQWVARLEDQQDDAKWPRKTLVVCRRLLKLLQATPRAKDDYIDGHIAELVGYEDLMYGRNGAMARWGSEGAAVAIPEFTRSLAAAQLLWPRNASRPEPTTNDPVEYCLEALCTSRGFDRGRLSRRPRRGAGDADA